MAARRVSFASPHRVEVRERRVPDPGEGELLVDAAVSAISPGTELLIYRGDVSEDLDADPALETLSGSLSYPVSYGYAAVGTVTAAGEGVDGEWVGRRVFAFHPHASRFVAPVEAVVPVPEGVGTAEAAFLANAETAVNFLLDGTPRVGERVVVFGQGVVGLLTTAILARSPVSTLLTADCHGRRRALSESLGADRSVDPDGTDVAARVPELARSAGGVTTGENGDGTDPGPDGGLADLAYELSGNPDALDAAIDATGYGGRVVVGSWYGEKTVELDLDGRYHRSRIELKSSQVSTLDPELRGRWSTDRRLAEAWRWVEELDVGRLVTHRIPVEEAPRAYDLLANRPEEAVQVLLTY